MTNTIRIAAPNLALQNVEMYSNSNSDMKENKKENTFQHDYVGNVQVPAAPLFPPAPSEPEVIEKQRGLRRLSTEDLYNEIGVQVNNIRNEGRYSRMNVYISIREENDKRYSIFLAGAATDCMTELRRGAKEDKTVLDIISTFKEEHPDCLIGRLHYRAVRGVKTTNFHRKLLRHVLIAVYDNNGLEAELFLLGDWYKIPLNSELSAKQQEIYKAAGIWRLELDQFSGDDELC